MCGRKRGERVRVALRREHQAPVVACEEHRHLAGRQVVERLAHRVVGVSHHLPQRRGDRWRDAREVALHELVVLCALRDLREVASPRSVIRLGQLHE